MKQVVFSIATAVLLMGCAQENPVQSNKSATGKLLMKVGDVPANVASVSAVITNLVTEESQTIDLLLEPEVTLFVGQYAIDVSATDGNDQVIYRGSSQFTLSEGDNLNLSIEMNPITGTVTFSFVWNTF